jgi:hypothetical protein
MTTVREFRRAAAHLRSKEWWDLQLIQLRGAIWRRRNEPVRRLIFIHIPKCAGLSITRFVKAHVGSQGSGRTCLLFDSASPEEREKKIVVARREATYVAGHFGWQTLERIRRPGDFVFTFLRDPLDRLRSIHVTWSGVTT